MAYNTMSSIAENIAAIRRSIDDACREIGREASDVKVVAVSKQQPDDLIDEALVAGIRLFGENRVQEASAHWGEKRKNYPDLRLHLIGALQTNKVAEAIELFDTIETVDRDKLAASLAKEMKKQGKQTDCLIQVNTGGEAQKSGIPPEDAVEFVHRCRDLYGLPVVGMMCLPPVDEEAAMHFALLAKLASEAGLAELSMGMSADYPEAARFGATFVRIGSALFGSRAI